MTQKQIRTIRERLEGELGRLHTGLERPRLAETAGDEGDQGQAMQEATLAVGTAETVWRRRQDIESAMAALDNGEYGICEDCGEEIAARRLEAAPWARRCVACEELREREGGGPVPRHQAA
jgi:DnaK suppressor protein